MYRKLLIATKNPGKLKEFRKILSTYDLISLDDLKVSDDVIEDGNTYAENSEKKARFYSELTGYPALADDGGLEISYLNNEPGVYSRRWLGYEASDQELFDKLNTVSKEIPDNNRRAWFRVSISFALPKSNIYTKQSEIEGIISKNPFKAKSKGLIYRLFFYLPEYKKFYHPDDLTTNQMIKVNHRYKAIKLLRPYITRYIS